ncbi:prolyl oligopeptidase family serine peptidase [Stenotrophomonas sp. SY1]|uniref:alpha/beta hydrolase family protein n=1 Tax=Stenotrophomonas sp. SY1 TaxID=477235 RepID=UPI001E513189|nr:prolyl oligopeptidase family serine peptidase [Stenotrophomonas sp. SY1]MCD9088610.1 prolyl oligopeptidase family serine peptidase [Stenotrophomonas sp. SY1]
MGIRCVTLLVLAVFGYANTSPVVAQTVPVEAFAKASPFSMPRLSPSGEYLAFATDFGGGNHALQVLRLADMQRTAVLRLPRYESPYQIAWVSDRRLVIAKGRKYGSLEKPIPNGEIIASDFDGQNQRYIYGYEQQNASAGLDRGFGFIEGVADSNDGRFYMRQLKRTPTNSMLYAVDTQRPTFKLIASINVPSLEFVIDRNGVARYAWGRDENDNHLLYASEDGQNWRQISQQQTGGIWTPAAFSSDNQQVYGRFSQGDGPSMLVMTNLEGGERDVLASDAFSNTGLSQWTHSPSVPFAASPVAGRPQFHYFDPGRPDAELHKALVGLLPQQHVTFDDISRDGQTVLVHLASDRDPGSWYLLRRSNNKLEKILSPNDAIDPALMAERRPVRFRASDGVELEGIFTIPRNSEGRRLPTVVLPHGGPHGVSDDWFYDADAQFLANRGYLVVQVNYRGSGGRGHGFEELGYLHWGTRVQQDVLEGLKEAEKQGLADTARVCTYGASFGAYSAMMLAAREPELIRCAVGLAGLYDLKMMYKKGDIKDTAYGRNYLGRVIGRSDEELAANSPTGVAARIAAPVFLAHGERDERTPIAQANAMRSALTAAGRPPQWMAVAGEGHGFYNDDNSVAFYRALETFLDTNIGH